MSEASISAYVALCSQLAAHEADEATYDRLCDRLDRLWYELSSSDRIDAERQLAAKAANDLAWHVANRSENR